jgi:hypothetical protein
MRTPRAASFVLLAGGVALVFAGLSSAFGFSITGMIASAAAIVALLYAGAVWLGAPAAPSDPDVVLFTPALTVASGPSLGRPVVELFPEPVRARLEIACREALEGRAARFSPHPGHGFAVSPVRSPDGAVVYGLLLSGRAAAAADAAVMSAV